MCKNQILPVTRSISRFTVMLVLIFAVSLLSVNAQAGKYYADESSINYWEAVDTLTTLGILEGRGGTGQSNFEPSGTITRAEAAKVCLYLALGVEGAKAEAATKATEFSDVPAAHWASGYIDFCSKSGIIHGVGADGSDQKQFKPEDPITGYEMMKLILGALGYGVNDEFVGSSWSIRVASVSSQLGLTRGILSVSAMSYAEDASYDSPAAREEAILYTFNALRADMVHWRASESQYVTQNKTLLSHLGGAAISGVLGFDGSAPAIISGSSRLWLPADTMEFRDIGRSVHMYYIPGADKETKAATDLFFDDTLLAEVYDGAGLSAWLDPSGAKYLKFEADTKLRYSLNGAGFETVEGETGLAAARALDSKLGIGEAGAIVRGSEVRLFDSDANGKADTVTVLTPRAALVLRGAADGGIFYPDSIDGIDLDFYKRGTVTFLTIGRTPATGDVILVYSLDLQVPMSLIVQAEKVTGEKTRVRVESGDTYIEFAGKEYTSSELLTAATDTVHTQNSRRSGIESWLNLEYNRRATLYLDKGGYVLHAATDYTDSPENYAFVLNAYRGTGVGAPVFGADLLLTDGRVVYAETDRNYGESGSNYDYRRTFVGYSRDSDDLYVLSSHGTTNGGHTGGDEGALFADKIRRGEYSISLYSTPASGEVANPASMNVNDSTTFIVRTTAESGDVSYKAYTGLDNIPEFTGTVRARLYYSRSPEAMFARFVYITNGENSSTEPRYMLVRDPESYYELPGGIRDYAVFTETGDERLTINPKTVRVLNYSNQVSGIEGLQCALYLVYFDGERHVMTRWDNTDRVPDEMRLRSYSGDYRGVEAGTIMPEKDLFLSLSNEVKVYFIITAPDSEGNPVTRSEKHPVNDITEAENDTDAEYIILRGSDGKVTMVVRMYEKSV